MRRIENGGSNIDLIMGDIASEMRLKKLKQMRNSGKVKFDFSKRKRTLQDIKYGIQEAI